MGFFNDIGLGLRTYFKATGFIFSKGLWWFFIFPVILTIILFFGGFTLVGNLTDFIKDSLFGLTNLENADFFLANYLKGFLTGFIWIIFKLLFFFVFTYFGGYIILILMSPVFAFLSEKTDKIITGKDYPFNAEQLMRDIVRGIIIALRNMFIELAYIIALFIICFIPIIGWLFALLSPVILFFISSYFYGFSFMDYTNERRKLSVKQSVSIIRKYKGLTLANGSVFSLSLLIPFCGALLAGFTAIVSVVAATLAMNEIEAQSRKMALKT